jgi:hypothetical protein
MFTSSAQTEKPKISVIPADNKFSTDPTAPNYKAVGDTFVVNVTAVDWTEPGVFALAFRLYYDNSILEALSIFPNPDATTQPADHFMRPGTHWPPGTYTKGGLYIVAEGTGVWQADGYAALALTLTGTEPGHVGTGTIAQITFKITAKPTSVVLPLSCLLELKEVKLSDPTPVEIPPANYDVENGYYEYALPPPPKPVLKVTPASFVWDRSTAEAADWKFNVTVDMQNLAADWKLVGVQFKLRYDTSILKTEPDWITQGGFFDPFIPHGKWFEKYVENDTISGYGIVGILILPNATGGWEVFPEGSGTIVNIQFEAIPPPPAECNLVLDEVRLVNDNIELIDYEAVNGHYQMYIAPPPWLSVTPKTVEVKKQGDTFDVNVVINELDKGFRMVGAEFKIRYNTSLLETKEEWITEGVDNIMREVADRTGKGLWFQVYVENDTISRYGLVGILIVPLDNGTWPYFPEGTGVLANIKFASIFQPETTDVTTLVYVDNVLLGDSNANKIAINEEKTAAEGKCTVTLTKKTVPVEPPGTTGRVIDLFTQYDKPYGGQGHYMPSDAFAPQGVVELNANVTYNGQAISGKLVAYQIMGPGGQVYASTTVMSTSDGIALLKLTLPSFSNPSGVSPMGLWTAYASVDIAGNVVNDVLSFRVGWPISVDSMTLSSTLVAKGLTYDVTSKLKIITMQSPAKCVQLAGLSPQIILAYNGFDELNQPIFSQYLDLTNSIGSIPYDASFVLNMKSRDYNAGLTSIEISPAAYSGTGKIYGNVFTDYPWRFGVPYAPAREMKITIGTVKILEPPTLPGLSVSSASAKVGQTANVDVTVLDVDADLHIVAIQFSLKYDTTVLEVTNVVLGDFMKQFGNVRFFCYNDVEAGLIVGEIQLPPWPGEKGWMVGSGTLASIEFKVVFSPSLKAFTLLELKNAFLGDAEGSRVNFKYIKNGSFVALLT